MDIIILVGKTSLFMPTNTIRIAKNTLMLYFRQILVMLVSLYTVRVVLNTLGAEDYGIYNVVGGVVAMFGVLNLTLAGGTQRFLTFQLGKNDFTELKKIFSTALNIHILLSVGILILMETVGLWFLIHKINVPLDRERATFWVYQFSVFASLLSIIQAPYNAIIIAHERMNIYAYISIIEVILKLVVVYVLRIVNFDKLIAYAFLLFGVYTIIMSIYRLYCRKQYDECRFQIVFDKSVYKAMLNFSGWNIIGAGAVLCATQGINILLNVFFNPTVNASRGISVQINSALTSFVANFQTAVNPQIVKNYASGKIEELHALLFQSAKFSFCLMWLLSLPFMLNLEMVLKLWLTDAPEYAAVFSRLILLQSLVYCLDRPFVTAIHAIGNMKPTNITAGIVLFMVLPVSYFLLKLGYPVYIPFVVYVFATVIAFSVELYFLRKWIKIPIFGFFKNVLTPVVLVILCSFPVPMIINYCMKDNLFSFLFVSLVSVLITAIVIYYVALDKNMQSLLFRRILKFVKKPICND
jgi:O-antigen/teichoic acid export membrane protein